MSSDEGDVFAGNVRKRRRLNNQIEPSSEDIAEASSDSPQSLHEEPDARQEEESRQQQRPRHRIHVVQNTDIAEDEFLTQVPTGTEDPNRIRGAYWLKAKPVPIQVTLSSLPLAPPSGISNAEPNPERDLARALRRPRGPSPKAKACTPDEASGTDALELESEAHLNDIEAALMEELADFHDDLQSPGDSRSRAAPTSEIIEIVSEETPYSQALLTQQQGFHMAAPRNNLRQTTLFGQTVLRDDGSATQASQSNRVRNWPVANRDEKPTHHKLDHDALKTWVYPTNLGTIRDYQYTIVGRGLFSNLLVALPTGLGKTFIAATIMLNWFRWTENAQIIFVAPTKPLVAQQVDACFHIAGIPRSTTTLLTGATPPALRAEEWKSKRVFFMTPQTILNDLKTGICDPKRIVLVVVDEAHRATGNYAYVEMVTFLRRFNNSFRVLALTATPGSSVESVQEVIDGLGIARTEIRTEESIDIRQYVHQRNIDTMLFDFSDEITRVMDLLSNAIRPVLSKLNSMNAYWSKDPMALTPYGCMMARKKWMAEAGKSANFAVKGMVNSIFAVLASLAHSFELLKFHGIVPFYHKIMNPSNDKKASKYETQIRDHADFKKMLSTVRAWVNNPDFLGHPKLEHLSSVVLNHFIDAGEGRGAGAETIPSATRVMIFAHYRDSAEEIVRVLNRHKPMVRSHVFVGQASTNISDGMDQKRQQEIIEKFKVGTYNTVVATSIGEEGLDIGEVDLIICYDASASPIRMLQRMGRTGRKRAGNICVLLMKKKEEDNFEKAKDNYEKMQQMIASSDKFTYHQGLSPRIVPKEVKPEVDKRVVEIPIENSQPELPEPKKRKGRQPKMPPKKFHMPDGVVTGFLKASEIDADSTLKSRRKQRERSPTPDPAPDPACVFLTDAQTAELESRFLYISGEQSETVEYPRLDKFPALNRQMRPTELVGHGRLARSTVAMLNKISQIDEADVERFDHGLDPEDQDLADRAEQGRAPVELETSTPKARLPKLLSEPEFDFDLDAEMSPQPPQRTRKRKAPTVKAAPAKKQKKASPKPMQSAAPVPKRKKGKRRPDPLPSPTPMPSSTADVGIDIMDTDGERATDEDDDGSDLLDFIDDEPQAQAAPSSSTETMMSLSARPRKAATPQKRRSPESDSDKENISLSEPDGTLSDSQPVAKPQRGRRQMILDSDDE